MSPCADPLTRRRDRSPGPPVWRIVLVAVLMAAPLASRSAQPPAPNGGRAHTVTIEGMRFNPRVIVVRQGDRITWTNQDPFPHTVTATDGKFDSHLIAPGGSWSYVARDKGDYDYGCTLHVTMKGRIEVR